MFFKFLFIVGGLLFSSPLSAENKFSDEAWKNVQPIYQAIVEHPFNRELAQGKLPAKVFDHYSEQDALFLVDFTKALGVLATKMEGPSDVEKLLKLALESAAESKREPKKSARQTPATLLYTNYLLLTGLTGSKEELAAALLPCFWIYLKVAEDLKIRSSPSNPFKEWIETYSSSHYRNSVTLMIELVNKLADAATPETRAKMMEAFLLASRMEWYFWEGAYQMESWRP